MTGETLEILPILPLGPLRMALERAAAEQILIEDRDLHIRGLPNVETIRVRRMPSDELEVYAINGEILAYPVATGTRCRFTRVTLDEAKQAIYAQRRNAKKREKRTESRPDVIVIDSIVWTRVDETDAARCREAIKVDTRGRDIIAAVDVSRYCYRMMCGCGRERFATPNTIHEVTQCRICLRESKLSNRRRSARSRSLERDA